MFAKGSKKLISFKVLEFLSSGNRALLVMHNSRTTRSCVNFACVESEVGYRESSSTMFRSLSSSNCKEVCPVAYLDLASRPHLVSKRARTPFRLI